MLARNTGHGFIDISKSSGAVFSDNWAGRGLALGDIDNDGKQDLVVLCIQSDKLTAPLKYEDLNQEGMLFPHIYGMLNTDAVNNIVVFPLGADGTFQIPLGILA